MSGEPRWSPEALYAHFDDRIDDLQAHFDTRLTSISKEIDRRVQSVHDEIEVRVRDQQITIDRTVEAITKLQSFQSKILGALALASVIVPTITGIVVYQLTGA